MGDFTRVKSPMKIHGRFYLSKKTPDYKMTHQLFTLFQIICNILTFHFYTFSAIYTFYFYIAFEELTFYQKCSIKCVLYSLFYGTTLSHWTVRLKLKSILCWQKKAMANPCGSLRWIEDGFIENTILKCIWTRGMLFSICRLFFCVGFYPENIVVEKVFLSWILPNESQETLLGAIGNFMGWNSALIYVSKACLYLQSLSVKIHSNEYHLWKSIA